MGSLFGSDDSGSRPQDTVVTYDTKPSCSNTTTIDEEIATPALKQDVEGDAEMNAENAARARQMKAGIGSTYTRFNNPPANAATGNGSKAKLGN